MTQEAVGTICEVSRSAVAQWEADREIPTIHNMLRLREALKFSLDWLYSGHYPDSTGRPALDHLMRVAEPLPDSAIQQLAREGHTYLELLQHSDHKNPVDPEDAADGTNG